MTPEQEIEQIKVETFERLNKSLIIIIEQHDGKYTIHQWMPDGVAPQSTYENARGALARVLQLYKLGPVAPQTWPEEIAISSSDGGALA